MSILTRKFIVKIVKFDAFLGQNGPFIFAPKVLTVTLWNINMIF